LPEVRESSEAPATVCKLAYRGLSTASAATNLSVLICNFDSVNSSNFVKAFGVEVLALALPNQNFLKRSRACQLQRTFVKAAGCAVPVTTRKTQNPVYCPPQHSCRRDGRIAGNDVLR
jgi:hypothetical protein